MISILLKVDVFVIEKTRIKASHFRIKLSIALLKSSMPWMSNKETRKILSMYLYSSCLTSSRVGMYSVMKFWFKILRIREDLPSYPTHAVLAKQQYVDFGFFRWVQHL